MLLKKWFFVFLLFSIFNLKSQTKELFFLSDIKLSNFISEFNNNKKITLRNSPRVSYQIGIGLAKNYNLYCFSTMLNIGVERISFKIKYNETKLPNRHTISYPNFNQLFSFSLMLNESSSFQFNYRLAFNGGAAISNGYQDTIPDLDENISFKTNSNFFDNRLGFQINRLYKKRIYAVYFGCEASLQQRQISLKFNNNYLNENKSYTISYQQINFNIGIQINNLYKNKSQID